MDFYYKTVQNKYVTKI